MKVKKIQYTATGKVVGIDWWGGDNISTAIHNQIAKSKGLEIDDYGNNWYQECYNEGCDIFRKYPQGRELSILVEPEELLINTKGQLVLVSTDYCETSGQKGNTILEDFVLTTKEIEWDIPIRDNP